MISPDEAESVAGGRWKTALAIGEEGGASPPELIGSPEVTPLALGEESGAHIILQTRLRGSAYPTDYSPPFR